MHVRMGLFGSTLCFRVCTLLDRGGLESYALLFQEFFMYFVLNHIWDTDEGTNVLVRACNITWIFFFFLISCFYLLFVAFLFPFSS